MITFIAAAGISSALGLWYYANDTRLAIDFMGQIGVQFQEELRVGKPQNGQISDELRAELRECSVPLSESATISPSKQPDEWRIDDPARQRRYVVRKSETQLWVYMIEQRLTGTFKMPNDLGAYLALGLPFCDGYFLAGWRRDTEQQRNRIRITSNSWCRCNTDECEPRANAHTRRLDQRYLRHCLSRHLSRYK